VSPDTLTGIFGGKNGEKGDADDFFRIEPPNAGQREKDSAREAKKS